LGSSLLVGVKRRRIRRRPASFFDSAAQGAQVLAERVGRILCPSVQEGLELELVAERVPLPDGRRLPALGLPDRAGRREDVIEMRRS